MTRERLHLIALAKKEIGFYSVLAKELKCDWEQAKKEFEMRGCSIDNEDDFGNQKQADIFGTFVNCTLCWNEQNGFYITYGWVLDDCNTDLYGDDYGNFLPYYDEKSKKEWLER